MLYSWSRRACSVSDSCVGISRKYAVIDFRGWRQVFSEERTTFSISDYRRYLREIKRLVAELGWLAQEVDLAIYTYLATTPIVPTPTAITSP